MRLLLDTHILIWALIEPARLNTDLRDMLESTENDVLFSAASAWEMAIKAALGRVDFGVLPGRIIAAARESGFVELPVTAAAALKVGSLPHHHRDPFDRLLVAQAVMEPAMLYTADTQLQIYSELVICV